MKLYSKYGGAHVAGAKDGMAHVLIGVKGIAIHVGRQWDARYMDNDAMRRRG